MSVFMTKKELAELAEIDYKRLFEIDKKLPEGEKLFVSEGRGKYDLRVFIRNWTKYNVSKAKPASNIMSATKAEISILAGYSDKQLNRIDKQLPEDNKLFVKGEDDKYDLAFFIQQWVRYNVEREAGDGYLDLDTVKARHEIIKTRKTELEVAKMKGQLLDKEDVKKAWGDVLVPLVQNISNMPKKLAPVFATLDNTEIIASMMDDEIRKIFDDAEKAPLPDYAIEDSEESEDDDMEG